MTTDELWDEMQEALGDLIARAPDHRIQPGKYWAAVSRVTRAYGELRMRREPKTTTVDQS